MTTNTNHDRGDIITAERELRLCCRRYRALCRQLLGDLGITPERLDVLEHLAGAERPVTARDVAAALPCNASAAHRILSGLVTGGLAEYEGEARTRRRFRVTARGLETLRQGALRLDARKDELTELDAELRRRTRSYEALLTPARPN